MHVSAAGAPAPARLPRGLLLAALAATLWTSAARAMTLEEALASAYATNPQLASARATLRRTDELVPRAQGALDATREHERALQADVGSSERRQAAGLVTATDVAGSRSQLAAATARRIQAEGDLEIAREVFRSIIGAEPDSLSPPPP